LAAFGFSFFGGGAVRAGPAREAAICASEHCFGSGVCFGSVVFILAWSVERVCAKGGFGYGVGIDVSVGG
jgi:hypothetical protein